MQSRVSKLHRHMPFESVLPLHVDSRFRSDFSDFLDRIGKAMDSSIKGSLRSH